MSRDERDDSADEFGDRLLRAIAAKKVTQTRTERELGLPRGYMTRLLGHGRSATTSKPVSSPGPEMIKKLADYLGVDFAWLAIGRGPMHPDGATSALEDAMIFAERYGMRRDAIDLAVERLRNVDLSGREWLQAFELAGHELERRGVPRPEIVEKTQKTVNREAKKFARQKRTRANLRAEKARELEKRAAPPALPPAPVKREAT